MRLIEDGLTPKQIISEPFQSPIETEKEREFPYNHHHLK